MHHIREKENIIESNRIHYGFVTVIDLIREAFLAFAPLKVLEKTPFRMYYV